MTFLTYWEILGYTVYVVQVDLHNSHTQRLRKSSEKRDTLQHVNGKQSFHEGSLEFSFQLCCVYNAQGCHATAEKKKTYKKNLTMMYSRCSLWISLQHASGIQQRTQHCPVVETVQLQANMVRMHISNWHNEDVQSETWQQMIISVSEGWLVWLAEYIVYCWGCYHFDLMIQFKLMASSL